MKVLKMKADERAIAQARKKAEEEEAKKKAIAQAQEESKKRAAIRSGEKAGLASLSFFERKAAERLAKKQAQQKK